MKTLILSSKNDFRILSFISPLQNIVDVGIMREWDEKSYNEYAPDFVMSDDMNKTPGAYNLIEVTKLPPFINLNIFKEAEILPKYNSDIAYIGPVTDFDSSMLDLLRMGYNVRHFFNRASTFTCYSGDINMSECYNIYKNSKVCPIPENDLGFRELDIIVSGGNPLKYKDRSGFIREAIKGIEGKKFSHKFSKDSILMHHTNYDRVASELKKIGFDSIAKKVLDRKQACLV